MLDLLIFKLEEESLVLTSGRHHWLPRATSEVEFVLSRIQEMETNREILAAEIGSELGLGSTPSLADIADASPEPWSGTFRDHRRAFQSMLSRTQEVAQRNREVLAKYVIAVSDALSIMGSSVGDGAGPDYSADGTVRAATSGIRLLDARG